MKEMQTEAKANETEAYVNEQLCFFVQELASHSINKLRHGK